MKEHGLVGEKGARPTFACVTARVAIRGVDPVRVGMGDGLGHSKQGSKRPFFLFFVLLRERRAGLAATPGAVPRARKCFTAWRLQGLRRQSSGRLSSACELSCGQEKGSPAQLSPQTLVTSLSSVRCVGEMVWSFQSTWLFSGPTSEVDASQPPLCASWRGPKW